MKVNWNVPDRMSLALAWTFAGGNDFWHLCFLSWADSGRLRCKAVVGRITKWAEEN